MQYFSLNTDTHAFQCKCHNIHLGTSSFVPSLDGFFSKSQFDGETLEPMKWELASTKKDFRGEAFDSNPIQSTQWVPFQDNTSDVTMDTNPAMDEGEKVQSDTEQGVQGEGITNPLWAPLLKNRIKSRIEKEDETEWTDDEMVDEECSSSEYKLIINFDDEEDEDDEQDEASEDDKDGARGILDHLIFEDEEEPEMEDIIISIKRTLSF